MNNKGQVLLVSIITAIVFFLVGMMIINLLKPEITNARSPDNLDCINSNISDSNKALCLVVDTTMPMYILMILAVAGGIITARLLL